MRRARPSPVLIDSLLPSLPPYPASCTVRSFNMAPRPSVAPRAPSAGPHTTPVDPALIKRLKSDALAEHFRFAPETFAKGGMDLANRTMYTATAKVEQSLQKLVEEGVEGFNEDEVQRVSLFFSPSSLWRSAAYGRLT